MASATMEMTTMHSNYALVLAPIVCITLLAGCSLDSGAAAVTSGQLQQQRAKEVGNLPNQVEKQLDVIQTQRNEQLQKAGDTQ
ncbi:MAG: hypothetical protein ACRCTU_06430 [Zoogloea sp.]|uniref:hypothetical protein n=1 Tax=Zoogloea sp. TaxID=49181 RepID=UPI003F32CF6A